MQGKALQGNSAKGEKIFTAVAQSHCYREGLRLLKEGKIESTHIHSSMHSYMFSVSVIHVYVDCYMCTCICPSNIERGYIAVMLFLVHQMIENLEDNTSHCALYGKQALPHNTGLLNTHVTAQARTIPYKNE